MRLLIFLCLLITTFNLKAEEIILPSGQEIIVHESGDTSADLHALWLPSEKGLTPALSKLAKASSQYMHIIMPDLHESYFLPTDRHSLSKIPSKDIDDLIRLYSKKYPELFLIGNSRTAKIILNSTRRLQNQDKIKFAGIVLISPHLRKEVPDVGKKVTYMETAFHSNLPIYIFQPQRSTRFVPVQGLVEALREGGSEVYLHPLVDVRRGYLIRDKEHWQAGDKKAQQAFPMQLKQALSILKITDTAPVSEFKETAQTTQKALNTDLQVIRLDPPKLTLKDLNGKSYSLDQYKGKTVIVSFWATWCAPCLEEMPSLVKLKEKYKDTLEILAVNILEDKETIEKFTQKMGVNFPILKTQNSTDIEEWKVYVYPSNFILDKQNKIRYATTGAIDWQTKEVDTMLDKLQAEKD